MLNRRRKLALVALGVLAGAAAHAQDEPALPPDVEGAGQPGDDAETVTPRGDDLARPPDVDAARPTERPGAARLADPPEREGPPREEVVVVGEQRWGLPDLGSEFRQAQQAQRDDARIKTEFFSVYNPGDPTNRFEPYPLDGDATRVGFIELFRVRFGRE